MLSVQEHSPTTSKWQGIFLHSNLNPREKLNSFSFSALLIYPFIYIFALPNTKRNTHATHHPHPYHPFAAGTQA